MPAMDNGWALSLLNVVLIDFDKSIMKYPEHQAIPGRSLERSCSESPGSGKTQCRRWI